jgi:hypothetical protein
VRLPNGDVRDLSGVRGDGKAKHPVWRDMIMKFGGSFCELGWVRQVEVHVDEVFDEEVGLGEARVILAPPQRLWNHARAKRVHQSDGREFTQE